MKTYIIKRTDNANLKIGDAAWESANKGSIDQYPWEGKRCPETSFSILYDEKGIGVLFETNETDLLLRAKGMNDINIWCDSCVEIFFNASPETTDKYLSFELSANGSMLINVGKDRYDREFFEDDFSQFDIETRVKEDGWCAKIFIPFEFVKKYSEISKNMLGNLQKCSGSPEAFHTGSWNFIGSEEPDFHLSEYFGRLVLE